MSFKNIRDFIRYLEEKGELIRIREEVDPVQEITIIQHKVMESQGPALLFENLKGHAGQRLVSNLFGTQARTDAVFGRHPGEIGEILTGLVERLVPPSPAKLWKEKKMILRLLNARMRKVSGGPVMQEIQSPSRLEEMPVLTCWPLDGGPFYTLPLVHTRNPETGVGNLGIYRMQRYDNHSTGMHWQIEKGGGFHFKKAVERGEKLPISVILGGPPALIFAAIAPLPEGIDERLLAALIMGKPLDVVKRKETDHMVPVEAEYIIEGYVESGNVRREGPFGDHLGHYSYSSDFPVFQADRVLKRKDAIYPATVVGKPPQEDYYIGCALQEMTMPVLRLMHPGILDLWAYPESGFHPLAAAKVKERYPREAMKQAFAILGQGQLSLTKILIMVGEDCVDIRDFKQVSKSVWDNLDAADGVHLIAPTAQDTLDFTGPVMNQGSRLILLAPRRDKPVRNERPPEPPKAAEVHPDVLRIEALGEAFLIVQVKKGFNRDLVLEALKMNRSSSRYLFHVLVSDDVDMNSTMMVLWGIFTRFDPLADLYPADRKLEGNRIVFKFPIGIDASWKEGYRKPVAFDPDVLKNVERKWDRLGLKEK